MTAQTLNFGLLLLPGYQWLDAAGPVDYINCHGQDYLRFGQAEESLINRAPIIVWHYISSDLKPVRSTSGPLQTPSCTYADCPDLNYLVVPGPDPQLVLPEGCAAFLQNLMAKDSFKGLLTVCTAAPVVARSGILDGLHVCSNKYALKMMASAGALGKVKWIGDRRWHVDGKVWSAAGVTSGLDLAAEFARVHFDPEVVAMVKDMNEYEANPAHPDPFARILEGVSLA